MDNALCGGAGATLTGNALAAVKAAIFMGDPHNRAGLPYNVGTCTAQGVSSSMHISPFQISLIKHCSSLPVPKASSARPPTQASSSRTATPPIHTAAMATMPTLTSSTSTSTARRLWLSSSPSLLLRLGSQNECVYKSMWTETKQIRCKYYLKRNMYMPSRKIYFYKLCVTCFFDWIICSMCSQQSHLIDHELSKPVPRSM